MARNILEEYWHLIQVVRGYAEYERRYVGNSVLIEDMQEKLDFFAQAWQQKLMSSVLVQSPLSIDPPSWPQHPPWLHQEKRKDPEENAEQKPLAGEKSEGKPLGMVIQETKASFLPGQPAFVPDIEKYRSLTLEERKQERERVRALALQCKACRLCQNRSQVVFGAGPLDAKLVIVGEAPGFYEDKEGLPFVGDSGDLLTKMLLGIGIQREEVYICNVVQCRPPSNRTPAPEEALVCNGWLKAQLHLLRPNLIFSMGVSASRVLTGIDQSMWRYRNTSYSYEGTPVLCSYHPSYLLRNPDDKKKAWQDLLNVKSYLDGKKQQTMQK